jgi:hypothetical protein
VVVQAVLEQAGAALHTWGWPRAPVRIPLVVWVRAHSHAHPLYKARHLGWQFCCNEEFCCVFYNSMGGCACCLAPHDV